MNKSVGALLPELWLLVGSLVVLLSGSFLPRRRLGWVRALTAVALLGSGVSAAVALAGPDQLVYDSTFAVDPATGAVRLIAVVATLFVVALAGDELRDHLRQGEICALLLLATLGTVLIAGAHDLLIVVTGFLLASVPLYALVGLTRSAAAAEAALKTYFFGSLFGIVLMAGVVLLYGLGGETSYTVLTSSLTGAPQGPLTVATVGVVGGLMFKAGAVPGHFWVPDATQGSSSFAASFLTTVPKLGALVAVYRLVVMLPPESRAPLLVGILAVVSMTLGNLAAFGQDDPRRLLGWSTVSQVGYLLVPVAVAGRTPLALGSLLVYLAGYALTNITAFAVVAALPERRTLASYTGLASTRPWLAGALVVSLLGLVGTPPTAVFAGKLAIATAAWEGGAAWLTAAVLVNSLLSLFYYLRWIAPLMRSADPPGEQPLGTRRLIRTSAARTSGLKVATVGAAGSLALGILSGTVWEVVTGAVMR
ncbi:MAG: NADH-quinone oxidoreductase subunit N [Actinomycetota bacterium]|nr:NADH-quinone oxidoreductase subunit N [Actinomycetota bacterium]